MDVVQLRSAARSRSTAADMGTWRGTGGFSVDGSVRIEAEDRAGLERLVRYCARGPLALERLYAPAGIGALSSPEARLVYRLPEPDLQGRQALRLTPLELLQRLARLVPPPDQRFASVPYTDTATTGSSPPTRASGPPWSRSDGPYPTTSRKPWGLPRHPINPTGS